MANYVTPVRQSDIRLIIVESQIIPCMLRIPIWYWSNPGSVRLFFAVSLRETSFSI